MLYYSTGKEGYSITVLVRKATVLQYWEAGYIVIVLKRRQPYNSIGEEGYI